MRKEDKLNKNQLIHARKEKEIIMASGASIKSLSSSIKIIFSWWFCFYMRK